MRFPHLRYGCIGFCVWLGLSGPSHGASIRDLDLEQRVGSPVDMSLAFTNEHGRPVTLAGVTAGRPAVMTLGYYACPRICGLVTDGLRRALHDMDSLQAGRDYSVFTVSIDPKETPRTALARKRALMAAVESEQAVSHWAFLTGEPGAIARLAESVGFRYQYDPTSGQFAHAAGIIVLTPDGRVARYFFGLEYSARDLRLALIDAAGGKIGTISDEILLFCYGFDCSQGKYTLQIQRIIQCAGCATVVALLCGIAGLSWVRRRGGRQ